jgi:Leucine-rich repeat (LRR) protein
MQLKHFEKIDIRHALFKTLPEELCDVHSLKYLELRDCSEMISLPDSLGNLTNLQLIDLTNASSLQMLPSSFGNLIGLKDLFLRGCPNLTISNESFGNINTLQHLDLKGCSNVKELPPQVAHQRFLVKLDVSATMLRGLPANGIGELSRMEALELGGDRLLELLSPLLVYLRSLKELWLFNCPVLKCFPNSFGLLTQLIWLKIENCPELKCLPDSFGLLTQLTLLEITDCPELKCLPDSFGLLTQLMSLTIENCGIEYLPQNLQMNNLDCPLRELPFRRVEGEIERELNTLDKCMFHGGVCPNLQRVCPNLRSLYLHNCRELRQIGRLCGLPKLEYLHLNECENIEELSSVVTLISLKELDVSGCAKLEKIEGLGKFIELPGVAPSRVFTVNLNNCPKLQLPQ